MYLQSLVNSVIQRGCNRAVGDKIRKINCLTYKLLIVQSISDFTRLKNDV